MQNDTAYSTCNVIFYTRKTTEKVPGTIERITCRNARDKCLITVNDIHDQHENSLIRK